MKTIKLSEKFTIHKDNYRKFNNDTKEELLKYIALNDRLVKHTNNNSVWIEIVAPCFLDINEQVKNRLEFIEKKQIINYAEHYWVYTQTKGFDLTWMHQHLLVHPGERSHISTDYTFTCYIQTPKDVEGDEGHIVFEDENKTRHKFLPQEGDIFIFPADLRHTAIPTPKSEIDRIVYAGSICLDINNQTIYKKSIL